ncbi:MAG: BBP7 family outer membrane beta-barrel protein [Planctomycetota bacterium]
MKNLIASIALICSLVATGIVDAQENRTQNTRVRQSRPKVGVPTRRDGQPVARSKVTSASHTEVVHGGVIHEGPIVHEGQIIHDGVVSSGCSSCGGGCEGGCDTGCDSCSVTPSCDTCAAPRGFCICFPAHGWVHAEYLMWYASGMDVPPLVTTSSDPTLSGVLNQPTASILFGGNEDILNGQRNGFRIRFGWWLSSFPKWGIEGEYVGLGEDTETFFRQSTGDPILSRPIFDANVGRDAVERVAFPGDVTGSIGINVNSEFDGAAFRFRRQLFGTEGCGFSNLRGIAVPYSSRFDVTLGYRFWELDESIVIREQLQKISTPTGSFDITDHFATRNQFNGGELGFIWQGRRGWWSVDALMRLGIGNVHQTVNISGSTQTVTGGVTSNFNSGILALDSNIGTYDRDQFTMIPELGLTVGYQLTKRLRATMGYSAIYWGNVVRPGQQIDLDVNPNLFRAQGTVTGPNRPVFNFVETDFLVHGLSFGAEFRW